MESCSNEPVAVVTDRPLRLAVVAQHPIHYHLVLYRAMEADPDIDAEVLFMQRAHSTSGYDPELDMVVDWGVPMFEGYASNVFRNMSPWRNGEGFWKFINPGLVWRVLAGPYDAVYIHGRHGFIRRAMPRILNRRNRRVFYARSEHRLLR